MIQTIKDFYMSTGFSAITWGQTAMICVSFVLMYLAIKKGFEPLLLVPIAFGMFLTNLPLAGLMAPQLDMINQVACYTTYTKVTI